MIARTHTLLPQRKVLSGAIAGALCTVLLAGVAYLRHQPLPDGLVGAAITLFSFAVSYFVPPKVGEIDEVQVPGAA